MPELSPEQLQQILDKLDSVCKQAEELREQIKQTMSDRARGDRQRLSGEPGKNPERSRR